MKENKKRNIMIITGIFLVIILFLGLTYAYWQINKKQEEENLVSTSCFDIEFEGFNDIKLENQFPVTDEIGMNTTPYTFTIKNTCNIYASYQVNLEVLKNSTLNKENLKISIDENKSLLTNNSPVTPTLSNADYAYKITIGELYPGDERTYTLKEWVDNDTPITEMDKTISTKLTLIATPDIEPNFLKNYNSQLYYSSDIFLGNDQISIEQIKSLKFTTTNATPDDIYTSWDVSEKTNGTVMAWAYQIENDMYDITIGANGGVYAPIDSSYLFFNLDKLKLLDLTNFNTKYVEKMGSMLSEVGYDPNFTLKLGNDFDTSRVTDMSLMFSGAGRSSQTFTLDLGSKFDTSKVTNMEDMFAYTGTASPVFTLNLGDKFDTANVINMSSMFFATGRASSIFILNLGDKFNTSSVSNMSYMFADTGRDNPNFTVNAKDTSWNTTAIKNNMFEYGKTTHKFYAKDNSAANFITGAGFIGTVFNCSETTCS